MDLYLIRHAPAGDPDAALWPDDTMRPLTDKGKRKFKKAARGLAQVISDVDAIVSSPSVRAWQTAEILSNEAGWPNPVAIEELRGSDTGSLLRGLQPYARLNSLVVVGHEPHLSRFAAALLSTTSGAAFELKKGAAIHLRLPALSNVSSGELVWSLPPKVLRALG